MCSQADWGEANCLTKADSGERASQTIRRSAVDYNAHMMTGGGSVTPGRPANLYR